MRLFDWLTAGPKAAEKVLDGTISGIDKLILTEEERIDARQKFLDSWLQLQATLGEETTAIWIHDPCGGGVLLWPLCL
jgi:hypothetical protein